MKKSKIDIFLMRIMKAKEILFLSNIIRYVLVRAAMPKSSAYIWIRGHHLLYLASNDFFEIYFTRKVI